MWATQRVFKESGVPNRWALKRSNGDFTLTGPWLVGPIG